uniref:Osteoclast-stimulating factor 1 n=1 Tax=Oryzias sinensis TaxID=183150 RepID=A0A8C8DI15_9TELE
MLSFIQRTPNTCCKARGWKHHALGLSFSIRTRTTGPGKGKNEWGPVWSDFERKTPSISKSIEDETFHHGNDPKHTLVFPAEAKKRHCKVLFDYQPLNEDELELKKGDVIEITEEVEEGWWSGSLNGKSGLFPSNFVKEMEAAGEDVESSDATPDDADGATTPTSPQSTSGSGAIAQPKKVQRFGYGDIFKESSFKLKVGMLSPETDEKKRKPVPSLPSSAKPTPTNTTEPPRAEADAKPKAKEFCRVMFAFEGTHEDELSLKEGDIVQILRMTSD